MAVGDGSYRCELCLSARKVSVFGVQDVWSSRTDAQILLCLRIYKWIFVIASTFVCFDILPYSSTFVDVDMHLSCIRPTFIVYDNIAVELGKYCWFCGEERQVCRRKKTWKILFSKHRNPQSKVMFTPTVARNTDLPFWIDLCRQTNTGVLQLWRQTPRSCLMSPTLEIFIKCQMVSDFLIFSV